MWLYDLSLQEDEDNFEVSIFRRKDQIPRVGPGDVVYLKSARVIIISITPAIHSSY